MRGFKVADACRSKTVGIACKSLDELIDKGKDKLKISRRENVKVFLPDGTEVDSDEYFQSLPNQTFLLLKQDHEDILTGAELIYNALRYVNIEIIHAGEEVKKFMDENIKEKICVLAEAVNKNDICRANLSDKRDDPDWFQGLETNANTKEAFMFRRSQERIRGYFYKTKSDIKKSHLYSNNSNLKSVLDGVFSNFTNLLNKDKYFGCLFDRSLDGALCDKLGSFKCAGIWKNSECRYNEGKRHLINPYSSKEERIIFSTWNLDHGIERSRTIIPALIDAADSVVCKEESKVQVNVAYFYSLLFTTCNLRLVHIVCHDKGKHFSAKCDPRKTTVYVSCKRNELQKVPTTINPDSSLVYQEG